MSPCTYVANHSCAHFPIEYLCWLPINCSPYCPSQGVIVCPCCPTQGAIMWHVAHRKVPLLAYVSHRKVPLLGMLSIARCHRVKNLLCHGAIMWEDIAWSNRVPMFPMSRCHYVPLSPKVVHHMGWPPCAKGGYPMIPACSMWPI